MLRALICSILCIAKNIKQKSVTRFKKWFSQLAQRVENTVIRPDFIRSSGQAHQLLSFFKKNIKCRKIKILISGAPKSYQTLYYL